MILLATAIVSRPDLARMVTYLNILKVMRLLILAERFVRAFVRLDSLPKVFQRLEGVLVSVIGTRELQSHIGFQQLPTELAGCPFFLFLFSSLSSGFEC